MHNARCKTMVHADLANRSSEEEYSASKGAGTKVFLEGEGLSWALKMVKQHFFSCYTKPLLIKALLLWSGIWISEMKLWASAVVNGVFSWQRNTIKYQPKRSQIITTRVYHSNLVMPEIGHFHFILLEQRFSAGGYFAAQGTLGNTWRYFWLEKGYWHQMDRD